MDTIELPLDERYVTPEGFYMAGYLWGKHVRSPKDAKTTFPGEGENYEAFLKGVEDGYGDALARWDDGNAPAVPIMRYPPFKK